MMPEKTAGTAMSKLDPLKDGFAVEQPGETLERAEEAKELNELSRGHIEAGAPADPVVAQNLSIESVKNNLNQELGRDNVEVLPGKNPIDEVPPTNEDTRDQLLRSLEQDSPETATTNAAESPDLAPQFSEIHEKIQTTATDIEAGTYDETTKNSLELAVKEFATRVQEAVQKGASMTTQETADELKKLADESKTLGTAEWVSRFTTKENAQVQNMETAQKAGAAYKTIEDLRLPIGRLSDPIKKQSLEKEFFALGERMMNVVNAGENTVPPEEIERLYRDAEALKQKTAKYAEAEVGVSAPTEGVSANSETEKEGGAKEKDISKEIEARFQKDFAFAQEDLKNIVTKVETQEGEKTVRFSDLTEGQQLLLLENLKDFALDNAKEQALKHFTETEKEKQGNAGFIKKAFLSVTKTYRRAADMAQIEKDMLAKPEMEKGTYTEVLREMLGMASEAPEAEWKNGKLQVNFALEKDFNGLDLKALNRENTVHGFNDTAAKFAELPPEWAYSTNENEQKQYQETKAAYAEARGQLLNLKAEGGKEAEALAYIASLDKKVQFSQLFQTNPGVEKVFAKTKDQKAWVEGIKSIVTERGKLMLMGKALRTAGMAVGTAVAVGSGLAAPLAVVLGGGFAGGALSGGIIGRYMAGKRAKQELEDKKNLAVIGITDQSNEKEFRSAVETKTVAEQKGGEEQEIGVGLADKLGYAIERALQAQETGTDEEKEKLLKNLGDRLYYTEKKVGMGVVSFGEGAEGFKNRYELLSALAKARTLHEMNEPETNKKIEQKIDEILGTQKDRITGAEKEYASERTRQGLKYGILLGGTFGTIASSIVHAYADTTISQIGTTSPSFKIPEPIINNSLLETVTPNIARVSTNPFVDEILQKINLAKVGEHIRIPTAETVPTQTGAAFPVEEQVPNTGGVLFDALEEEGVSAQEIIPATAPDAAAVIHESTIGPEALRLPENALPQPPLGFSADHEGTFVPEAVTLSKGTFQMPRGYSVAQTLNDLPPEGTTASEAITPVAKTAEDLFPRSKFGFSADYPGTFIEEPATVPQDALPAPTGRSVTETLTPRETAIEKSLAELGKIYEVEKGDTIWDINKSQLDENEYWNSLTPRQQNFILDTMRHDLLNRSKSEIIDMGIKSGDINRIYPGDKIDFSKVFDKEELARIFSKAETKGGVSPASETHHAAPEIHQPTPTHTAPERLYPPQTIDSPRNDFIEYQVEKPLSEISMPETNSTDAFSLPAESIPSHYIEAVYEGIHEARPDIPQGFYDMKVADFLAAHPGGMKELDQIFHMDGVKTPSGLTAATENDRIVDYYARTVLQAETLHQEHASVIDIADQAHASQGSAPTAEMTANTAELSGFKTSFEKWSILPNEVKEYIATIDGQVGKNINHDVWEKLRTMPIKDVLGDPRNASVQARVEFLQRNADILNHPKLNIIEHETLEHYLARLARELTFRPNPPEIPKNM